LKTNLAYFTNHEYNLKHVQMQALETSDVTIKKSFSHIVKFDFGWFYM